MHENLTGSVTIAAGEASKDLAVTPLDKSVVEVAEPLVLTLTAGAGYELGTAAAEKKGDG